MHKEINESKFFFSMEWKERKDSDELVRYASCKVAVISLIDSADACVYSHRKVAIFVFSMNFGMQLAHGAIGSYLY